MCVTNRKFGMALVLALGVICLWLGHEVEAQKTKGKTRLAETRDLMKGLCQPHCSGLADLLKDPGPADAKAWRRVIQHASLLNEASYLLMDDGRCPDQEWASAVTVLRESSARVVDAANGKNGADARIAFSSLTTACARCHRAHKGN